MENTFIRGPVAEEGDAYIACTVQLFRQGGACAKPDTGTHDPVRAKNVALNICNMHRPAEP